MKLKNVPTTTIGRKSRFKRLCPKGTMVILAWDQPFEHGQSDYNNDWCHIPENIADIAKKAHLDGVIAHLGTLRELETYSGEINFILKINGRTKYPDVSTVEPLSTQLAKVKHAVELDCVAIGYTTYYFTEEYHKSFENTAKVFAEAYDYGLIIINWAYPRGKYVVSNHTSEKFVSYAAVAASTGFGPDFIKVPYTGSLESFQKVIKYSPIPILVAGGSKIGNTEILKRLNDLMEFGGAGTAIGRNIWQQKTVDNAILMGKAICKVIHDRDLESALLIAP
ncbi:MAG: class I fructose-bisphosphate aldolase [Candidatus Helarchaeota archaeon]